MKKSFLLFLSSIFVYGISAQNILPTTDATFIKEQRTQNADYMSEEGVDYVTLQPNPSSEEIRISSTHPLKLKAALLFDLKGQKVAEREFKDGMDWSIDISDIEDGEYALQLIAPGEILTKRFMKMSGASDIGYRGKP